MGTNGTAAPRILLIDDRPLVRAALARVVAHADPRAVVLEASDTASGVALLAAQPAAARAMFHPGPLGAACRAASVAEPPDRRPAVRLTARQRAVLALLLRGRPNKLICRTLDLREGTVKTHIANIFRALDVRNRTEAAYAAVRLGIELPQVEEPAPRARPARPPLRLVAQRA